MLWLLFVAALGVGFAVGAGLLWWGGIRAHRKDRFDGPGWWILAAVSGAISLVLMLVLAGTAIDRHYSERQCGQKNDVVGDRYVWMDYHYFGYECLLRTPSGNVTETPVLPLEDVTERVPG